MNGQFIKSFLKKTPTILSFLGAAGVITTSMLAVRVTPKALKKINNDSKKNHKGDPNAYTSIEAIKSAWIYYIPSIIIGASTIACIFASDTLNKNTQSALMGSYILVNESFKEYRQKLKTLYGEETHKRIVDEIAKDAHINAPTIVGNSSLRWDDGEDETRRLFYDSFSKRYFESTLSRVLEAEYHLNRNFIIGMGCGIAINDFYDFLGISGIKDGNDLMWFYEDGISWIDFDHLLTVMDDGLEVCIIDIIFPPRLEYE